MVAVTCLFTSLFHNRRLKRRRKRSLEPASARKATILAASSTISCRLCVPAKSLKKTETSSKSGTAPETAETSLSWTASEWCPRSRPIYDPGAGHGPGHGVEQSPSDADPFTCRLSGFRRKLDRVCSKWLQT